MNTLLGIFCFGIALSTAVPIDDGGMTGINKFSQVHSLQSSSSNINGKTHQESYFNNGAEINGEPVYLMGGEQNADDDDVREAFDMILPSENLHSHIDRHNGEENTFEEPLDEDEEMEDLDYSAIPEMRLGEADDLDYPLGDALDFNEESEDDSDNEDYYDYLSNGIL